MNFIWDLDGTLIDSYEIMVTYLKTLLDPYEKMDKEDIKTYVLKTSIMSFIKEKAKSFDVSLDQLFLKYKEMELAMNPMDYPLIKDAKDVLESLKNEGHQHFIYTHRGESTHEILKAHGLMDLFHDIITSAHGFERKPNPEALQYLLEKYQLVSHECYYVGDRELDILCGKNAGINTIYVGLNPTESFGATVQCKTLIEILDL
ncbi:MAG: HAD-IA family hydrolase [Clostridia bacterium]|nr:HAD-IA family hydrolase [Clostridia bacterium]